MAGCVLLNDLSVPHASYYRPPVKFKCVDGFLGIGPRCVPLAEVGDINALTLEVRINGALRQTVDFGGLVRDAATLLLATGVPLCGFRHLTGQPCPLCGGTHACAALAQGDLMVAWQANPGLMPLFVIAAARAAQLAWEAWTGRRVTRWRIGPALWKAGGLFLIGSWALRLAGVL